MNLEDVLKFISTAERQDCDQIINASRQRNGALQDAKWRHRVDDHWRTLIYLRKGDTVYCGALARFICGYMQLGDKAKVVDIELERGKLLWLEVRDGRKRRVIGFRPDDAFTYSIQRNKPEQMLSNQSRNDAKEIKKALQEVISTANAVYGKRRKRHRTRASNFGGAET